MPLYLVEMEGMDPRLVYGKTRRGVETYALQSMRDKLSVTVTSPLEAAILAKGGVSVERVDGRPDVVMENDPPEVRRGWAPPKETVVGAVVQSAASVREDLEAIGVTCVDRTGETPVVRPPTPDELAAIAGVEFQNTPLPQPDLGDHENWRLAGDPQIEDDGMITTHGLDNATERGNMTGEEDKDVFGNDPDFDEVDRPTPL